MKNSLVLLASSASKQILYWTEENPQKIPHIHINVSPKGVLVKNECQFSIASDQKSMNIQTRTERKKMSYILYCPLMRLIHKQNSWLILKYIFLTTIIKLLTQCKVIFPYVIFLFMIKDSFFYSNVYISIRSSFPHFMNQNVSYTITQRSTKSNLGEQSCIHTVYTQVILLHFIKQ